MYQPSFLSVIAHIQPRPLVFQVNRNQQFSIIFGYFSLRPLISVKPTVLTFNTHYQPFLTAFKYWSLYLNNFHPF